jgi:magnesium-transporting ATPase (P-type)
VVYAAAGALDGIDLAAVGWLPTYLVQQLQVAPDLVYPLATTVFHVGVVTAQVGNALTCRTETEKVRRLGWFSNRFLLFGIMIEILLIISINRVPVLAEIFGHAALSPAYWIGLGLYAPVLYALDRLRKSTVRRIARGQPHIRNGGTQR